jgi:hypothetical protein
MQQKCSSVRMYFAIEGLSMNDGVLYVQLKGHTFIINARRSAGCQPWEMESQHCVRACASTESFTGMTC